jgi:hypothetical protein
MYTESDQDLLPTVVTCNGHDMDFSDVCSVQASRVDDPGLKNWLLLNNLSVNNEPGNLIYLEETPLRASRILVFPDDVAWRYGFSFATAIKSPLGKKIPTSPEWRFGGLAKYGIVLYQKTSDQTLKAWQIQDTNAANPQEIELDPEQDIYVNVNDLKGSYGDNSGSFDLYIRIL